MKPLNKIPFILSFVLFSLFASAQRPNSRPVPFSITGHVVDSVKGIDLGFATISLHQQGSKSVQKSVIADSAGYFSIERLPAGKYSVTMQFTGYMPVSRGNIRLDNEHPSADLSTIVLAANEKTPIDSAINGA